MKGMKEKQAQQMGLKERVLREVGERFTKMALWPGTCLTLLTYEPELPEEIIKEMCERQ